MKLFFTIKSCGKRKAYLEQEEIYLDLEQNVTVEELLTALVRQQVAEFNERNKGKNLKNFFLEEELDKYLVSGKFALFKRRYSVDAECEKSIVTMRHAFEDGLIALFVNDVQYENLEEQIAINNGTLISIVRLTFLIGSTLIPSDLI